jgi:hypothetical protein
VIQIEPPFTVEFDVQKNLLGSSNIANFKIYNLSERSRAQIRKDPWTTNILKPIVFKAGYGEELSDVFIGNISKAWSVRNGTDWVTNIDCYGGSLAVTQGFTDKQFKKNTPIRTIIEQLIKALEKDGIKVGTVGNYTGEISRGNSFTGSALDNVQSISGGGAFIDNNKINVLKTNEALKGVIEKLDSSFGLLNTPIREVNKILFDIIFEPRLLLGQFITLDFKVFSEQNTTSGAYRLITLKHAGVISESTSGKAVTSVEVMTTKSLGVVG